MNKDNLGCLGELLLFALYFFAIPLFSSFMEFLYKILPPAPPTSPTPGFISTINYILYGILAIYFLSGPSYTNMWGKQPGFLRHLNPVSIVLTCLLILPYVIASRYFNMTYITVAFYGYIIYKIFK